MGQLTVELTVDMIDSGEIYLEKTAPLAERIDFAWSTYIEKRNKNALNFLIYAFDIRDTNDINGQLIRLMSEREKYKATNPEYIPGKAPSHLPFDTRTVIPKPISVLLDKPTNINDAIDVNNSDRINSALQNKELLDVKYGSKLKDKKDKTVFLNNRPLRKPSYSQFHVINCCN